MEKRVALITGGGTGVGRATVLQLAERGFQVAINYSKSAGEAETTAHDAHQLGVEALVLRCNVAHDDEVRKMVSHCVEHFGRLDVVVNNAATTHFVEHAQLEALTESMWDDILSVNLKGVFFVSRAALPSLRQNPGSAIVNVASVAGLFGVGSCIAYAASKGALITMTKSLARVAAPEVRVNAVCPGVIRTRWMDGHPEMLTNALPATPLKRVCEPEDVAEPIVFLACDAHMMTGQAIVIDGGLSI